MTQEDFTPQQSFQTISAIINEAKSKFEEDGSIYMLWGLAVAAAAFVQYFLIAAGRPEISYYPYFVMPIGSFLTYFYYAKKGNSKRKMTHIGKMLMVTWILIGINILGLAFGFASVLKASLIPLILILTGIGVCISGSILESSLLILSGILMNIIGLITFALNYTEQPLALGIANLLCVFLPGLLTLIRYRKRNV